MIDALLTGIALLAIGVWFLLMLILWLIVQIIIYGVPLAIVIGVGYLVLKKIAEHKGDSFD